MRLFALLFITILASATVKAQLIALPNGSFEHWHNVNGQHDDPDLWTTNNTDSTIVVYKDSVNKYDSSYSARVEANGVLNFPRVPYADAVYTMMIKASMIMPDTAYIRYLDFKHDTLIYSAIWLVTNSTGWNNIGIFPHPPISRDSVSLRIEGGHNAGTVINIDEVFCNPEGISDVLNGKKIIVNPNPMVQSTAIRFSNPRHYHYNFTLLDNLGRVVQSQNGKDGEEIIINRNALNAGIYFWELQGVETKEQVSGKLSVK